MLDPPFFKGAVYATFASALPAITDVIRGASGALTQTGILLIIFSVVASVSEGSNNTHALPFQYCICPELVPVTKELTLLHSVPFQR